MADAAQHASVVFAAIIPGRTDLLDLALAQLEPEHFVEPNHRMVLGLLQKYHEITSGVLPRAAVAQMMSRHNPTTVLLFEELYDSFVAQQVSDQDFYWALSQIRELAAERATKEALTVGMEVLTTGLKDNKGNMARGAVDARLVVITKFSEIDRALGMQDAPEGDVRTEGEAFLQDYVRRVNLRSQGHTTGVMLGVPELDIKIGGFQRGDLGLVAGYTSDGKSTLCAQGAWSAAVEQGKNVVILTTETVRDQYRRKLLARHSVMGKFGLPPGGLDTKALKEATVPREHLTAMQAIAADFQSNPDYGKLYIAQVPRYATISSVEARLTRLQRQFNIDIVYVDYLALLRADVRRDSDRESLGSILKEAKILCTTFNRGQGVPIISPWQVNREAKKYADQHKMYQSEHLAETAEATNTPDIVLSILADTDRDARMRDVRFQILKNRDGETVIAAPLIVRVDYGTCQFGSTVHEAVALAAPVHDPLAAFS